MSWREGARETVRGKFKVRWDWWGVAIRARGARETVRGRFKDRMKLVVCTIRGYYFMVEYGDGETGMHFPSLESMTEDQKIFSKPQLVSGSNQGEENST